MAFALLPLACGAADADKRVNDGRPPTLGVNPAFACRHARPYDYDALLPTGARASDVVSELGQARSATEVGRRVSSNGLRGGSAPPTTLTMSFEHAGGSVTYQDDCGVPTVSVPVMLSIRLSTGDDWQAPARLHVRTGLETTLTAEPTAQAPFYLTARLLRGDTEVELTPSGAARPTRFSTLCGTDVAATVASSFGTELSAMLASSAVPSLSCGRPGGARTRLETPVATKLLEHQTEACAPQPNAAPQFELSVGLVAAWADEPLRGTAAFHREGAQQALRYRVHGKARADRSLAALLPCAATDDSVSVALEGDVRGPAPVRSQPLKLTFTFSCEDVQIECTAL